MHNVTELYNIIHFFYENLNHNQLIPNKIILTSICTDRVKFLPNLKYPNIL